MGKRTGRPGWNGAALEATSEAANVACSVGSRVTFVVLSIGVLAGGCGNDSDEPGGRGNTAQEQAVRALVDEANSSFADGDYARTCRQYTERAQRYVMATTAATTCEQAWERTAALMAKTMTPAQIRATTEYGVEAVRIDGETAIATYGEPPPAIRDLPPSQEGTTIRVVRVDGTWQIDSFPTE